MYLGDYPTSALVDVPWNTQGLDGASITRATDGALRLYKNNSLTQRTSAAGITDSEDFDTVTGIHWLHIDTADNTDAGFYAAGNEYTVVLVGAVVDGKTVNTTLASFSIERAGGALALLKGATGLAAIAAFLDTEIAAIKAKTDNLPSDPADESLLEAAIAAVSGTPLVQLTGAGYIGDLDPGSTFDVRFETRKAGVLTTLAGSPVVSVYKDNGATQSVAGLTLTVDFDGIAGHHNLRVATGADGTFYSGNSNFTIVLTAGTVTGTSAIGLIGAFSHFARSALRPTTAGFTVDVAGDGSVTTSGGATAEAIADEVATRELTVGTVLDKIGYALSSAGIIANWSAADRQLTAFGFTVAATADPNVALIKTKTDFLPSATAGAAGGVFIAGSNAATAIATALTANVTGNLSGSVGSVTGAVGSVGTGGITAASLAADAITAAKVAADVTTELQTGLATAAALVTAQADLTTIVSAIDPTGAADIDTIKAKTEQLTFTTPNVVDSTGSGASAAAVADAVWDEALAGHVAAGSTGEALTASGGAGDPWITALPGAYGAGSAGKIVGDRIAASVTGAVGSVTGNVGGNVVGSVASVTGAVGSVTVVTDKTGYRLSSAGVDDMLRTALPESYAADGAAGTLTQLLYLIQQLMAEKSITTTTMTVKKLDGSTTAATFTLNSATTPTAVTRTT